MISYETMGKEELRQACRAAGISYSKLNNEGMREALRAAEEAAEAAEEAEQDGFKVQTNDLASIVQQISGANQQNVQVETTPAVAKRTSNGLKIEKDREERNGVKRPSAGGMCRAVWDFCDEQAERGAENFPTAKSVRAHAELMGWNVNNASIEFYQWRKFHGIRGRQ